MGINSSKNHAGFTVVEIAFVMVIAAVLLAATIHLIMPIIQTAQHLETQEKMKRVSEALNNFAIVNYRLPCPGEPRRTGGGNLYGASVGSGPDGDRILSFCTFDEGIVPFKTLGLPEDLVVDGWGNHFTYRTNRAFTRNLTNEPGDQPPLVHPMCRTQEWMMEGDSLDPDSGDPIIINKNPRKARFCCPDESLGGAAAADIIMMDANRDRVMNFTRDEGLYGYDVPNAPFRPIQPNPLGPLAIFPETLTLEQKKAFFEQPQVPLPQFRSTAIAYVLVSHGRDGVGSFQPKMSLPGGRRPATIDMRRQLQYENADGDRIFIDQPLLNTSRTRQQYDDLILWRTQDMIFAEEGESCMIP